MVGTLDGGDDADAPSNGGRAVRFDGLVVSGGAADQLVAASVSGMHLSDEVTPTRRVKVQRTAPPVLPFARGLSDLGGPKRDHEPPSIVEEDLPKHDADDEVPTAFEAGRAPRVGAASSVPPARYVIRQGSRTYIVGDVATLKRWIVEDRVGRRDEVSRDGGPWQRADAFAELAETFELIQPSERDETPLFAPLSPSFASRRAQPAEPPAVEDAAAQRRGQAFQTDPGSSPSDAGPATQAERWSTVWRDVAPRSDPATVVEASPAFAGAGAGGGPANAIVAQVRGAKLPVAQRPPREDAFEGPKVKGWAIDPGPAPGAQTSYADPEAHTRQAPPREDGPMGFALGVVVSVALAIGALWGAGLIDPVTMRAQVEGLFNPAPVPAVVPVVVEEPTPTPTPKKATRRAPTPTPAPVVATPTPALAPPPEPDAPKVKVYDHRDGVRRTAPEDE